MIKLTAHEDKRKRLDFVLLGHDERCLFRQEVFREKVDQGSVDE